MNENTRRRGRPIGSKNKKSTKIRNGRTRKNAFPEPSVNLDEIIEDKSKQRDSILLYLDHTDNNENNHLITVRNNKPICTSNERNRYLTGEDREPSKEEIQPMPDFYNRKDKSWPRETNIRCKWCTLRFRTVPLSIPEKQDDDETYYVKHVVCSVNCGYALLLNSIITDKTEKISLFFQFCKDILGDDMPEEIKPSPDKEILIEYGGTISRLEYKACLKTINESYLIDFPPVMSTIPQIVQFSKYLAQNKQYIKTDTNDNNYTSLKKFE